MANGMELAPLSLERPCLWHGIGPAPAKQHAADGPGLLQSSATDSFKLAQLPSNRRHKRHAGGLLVAQNHSKAVLLMVYGWPTTRCCRRPPDGPVSPRSGCILASI